MVVLLNCRIVRLICCCLCVFLFGSSPPSQPGWLILFIHMHTHLDLWNIAVFINIRTKGTLREVSLPPHPFYPVSFHPVFIPGFLSPTSHPHLRQPFSLVSGLSYFFLQKWPDPHRFSYIPFLLIFPNTRMLVILALLHLTGTLPWRTLEELWNLIWRTKGENNYSLTSVPFWSRVAPQALTLLYFGVQQVSAGVLYRTFRKPQGRSQVSVV